MSVTPASPDAAFLCPTCGTESAGSFCRNCGERKLGSEDRSLRHYFDIAMDFLTHFDSKGYRSLWLLVTRPGFLSAEQLRGSRVRYVRPLSLFISINVVYYFSIALFGGITFTTPLDIQLHMNDYYPGYAAGKVEAKLQKEGITYAALKTHYNDKAGVLSRTLIFLFIPVFALVFYACFFAWRRYFVEHVVVATHFWSFNLVLLAVFVPALTTPVMWWTGAPNIAAVYAANDFALSLILQVCVAAYLYVMLRRVYRANRGYCAAIALAIAWSLFHVVWLYRFVLFVITLHLI